MKAPALILCLFIPLPSLSAQESLKQSLVFHASFDKSMDADFSTGDKACLSKQGGKLLPCVPNKEVKLTTTGGKFGGCLHFPKKGVTRPQFSGVNMLGYNDKRWSATVSTWLKLTPDEDLEPGYCDPVQIVGNDTKKGFIFLEWSKNETPRFFRFAIRPLVEIWNPTNVQWDEIACDKRPMVQIANAPFTREKWTHIVFTLSDINHKTGKPEGSLYLNGNVAGKIQNWDLTFGWDPASVALVLGASYVGHVDDLAVFNRALNADEVRALHQQAGGVAALK